MTRAILAIALAACHPAAPAKPDQQAAERACTNVAHHMVDMIMPKEGAPPETIKTIVDLIVERCEQDGWSGDAQTCLLGMKSLDDNTRCEEMLTIAQRDALAKEMDEKLPRPAPGAPASE